MRDCFFAYVMSKRVRYIIESRSWRSILRGAMFSVYFLLGQEVKNENEKEGSASLFRIQPGGEGKGKRSYDKRSRRRPVSPVTK